MGPVVQLLLGTVTVAVGADAVTVTGGSVSVLISVVVCVFVTGGSVSVLMTVDVLVFVTGSVSVSVLSNGRGRRRPTRNFR